MKGEAANAEERLVGGNGIGIELEACSLCLKAVYDGDVEGSELDATVVSCCEALDDSFAENWLGPMQVTGDEQNRRDSEQQHDAAYPDREPKRAAVRESQAGVEFGCAFIAHSFISFPCFLCVCRSPEGVLLPVSTADALPQEARLRAARANRKRR